MTVDLEKSIIQELPQIPYVIDQVGEAFSWAKEVLNEGEYNKMLGVSYDVTMYTKTISDPNFFKVHYVIASILSYIPNASKEERFSKFDTASKSVEKTLNSIIVPSEDIEKRGCFKSVMLHLIPLSKKNEEVFAISLLGIKHDLLDIINGMKQANVKTPITGNDYISVLGYALVMANLRMSNLSLTNGAYKIYNDILTLLNNELSY